MDRKLRNGSKSLSIRVCATDPVKSNTQRWFAHSLLPLFFSVSSKYIKVCQISIWPRFFKISHMATPWARSQAHDVPHSTITKCKVYTNSTNGKKLYYDTSLFYFTGKKLPRHLGLRQIILRVPRIFEALKIFPQVLIPPFSLLEEPQDSKSYRTSFLQNFEAPHSPGNGITRSFRMGNRIYGTNFWLTSFQ